MATRKKFRPTKYPRETILDRRNIWPYLEEHFSTMFVGYDVIGAKTTVIPQKQFHGLSKRIERRFIWANKITTLYYIK